MRVQGIGFALVGLVVIAAFAGGIASCGDDSGVSTFIGGGEGGTDDGGNVFNSEAGIIDKGCKPKSCLEAGFSCGPNADGCGGLIQCGDCKSPEFCGGKGFSQCGGTSSFLPDGAVICNPTTCNALGFDCGPAGDGCGGLLSCGTCTLPNICGGNGKSSVCGNSVPCLNLCKQQVACDSGTTTITGKVVAGTIQKYGSPDPVPGVLVYVPNSAIKPFTKGVQCSQCGADVTGDPLVQTTTAVDGTFTLTNVPVGNGIPVVIQLGRWRRQVTFNVSQCVTTAVGDIHMPRNKGEGDIPLTAISTGAVDGMECVLLKMGVDQAEFDNPGGTGRMELYTGNGAQINNATPPESQLVTSLVTLKDYDQVLFPCWGQEVIKAKGDQQNVIDYADNGGRVFATHFSYTWLFNIAPWSSTATWNVNAGTFNSATGEIDTSFQKGKTFASWLDLVGALSSKVPPRMTVNSPRHDFDAVNAPAARWMYTIGQNPNFPLHYTFDTPWGKQNQCGRVVYSDFHVTNSNTAGLDFPTECSGNPMTPQEKALEYMIWDLASCVPPPPKPLCTPVTCKDQNITCGPAGDGCGGLLQCGTCLAPGTCGGGGKYGQCGQPDANQCIPKTCVDLALNCGPAGDGCGGLLNCGTCVMPDTCGGGGVGGVCGNQTPK